MVCHRKSNKCLSHSEGSKPCMVGNIRPSEKRVENGFLSFVSRWQVNDNLGPVVQN